VGAKLLVEIGSEGGRRHNSPLNCTPSSEGVTTEGPLGDEGTLMTNTTPTEQITLYGGNELNRTESYAIEPEPSELSSH
jgi:hypothetical protein